MYKLKSYLKLTISKRVKIHLQYVIIIITNKTKNTIKKLTTTIAIGNNMS